MIYNYKNWNHVLKYTRFVNKFQVDIENFLRHHPDHRLPRIKELALALTAKNILAASVIADVDRLDARWKELSQKAKQRTTILEGSSLIQRIFLEIDLKS